MYTLYYAPETCALASHIALEQVGAPYRAERLDFRNDEQRSARYLQVNPKGRVPALVTERGTLSETPAILLFVAQSYPEAAIAPLHDPFELARVNAFNSYLCSTVHVAHAHGRRGKRWADDESAIAAMKRKVAENMSDCFALIEQELFVGPFVFGERYGISDMYLYTIARWLEGDGVEVSRFPKVADFRARMERDPAVQKVLAAERSR